MCEHSTGKIILRSELFIFICRIQRNCGNSYTYIIANGLRKNFYFYTKIRKSFRTKKTINEKTEIWSVFDILESRNHQIFYVIPFESELLFCSYFNWLLLQLETLWMKRKNFLIALKKWELNFHKYSLRVRHCTHRANSQAHRKGSTCSRYICA